jgi:dimethylhistidine N-methyltransferase
MREEVLEGLWHRPKRLPCKLFYDETGSLLFDQICELQEYYPTRTETAILRQYGPEMAAQLGSECRLVEYGSGNGIKTRLLLDCLIEPTAYVPIDISREHLLRSAAALSRDYPSFPVLPVCADYTTAFDLPEGGRPARRTAVFFSGSTIGNFEPGEAVAFLRGVADVCGAGGGLLIGVDLKKDPALLHAAYNDREGVTAAFNLNLLHRINRELNGDVQVEQFVHHALYNPRPGRIEMHLVSMADQVARIGDARVRFREGESILTEYSYKYTPREFARLAARAGFAVQHVWTDERRRFSVQLLTVR